MVQQDKSQLGLTARRLLLVAAVRAAQLLHLQHPITTTCLNALPMEPNSWLPHMPAPSQAPSSILVKHW